MQSRRDELKNNVEDARLALLMDEFCEEEGAKLLAESDNLNRDLDASVSVDLHQRLQNTVDKHFAAEERAQKKPAMCHALKRVLIAAVIAAVMFTTAFATIEDFRVGILNFSLKMQEKYSTLDFEWNNNKSAQKVDYPDSIIEEAMQFGEGRIVVDFDLSDFEILENIVDEVGVFVDLRAKDGDQTVVIEASDILEGMNFQVDTENADSVVPVEIGSDTGYMIVKGDRCYVVWANSESNKVLEVTTNRLGAQFTLALADCVTYVGEKSR